jgi:hypothetical protein
MALSSSVGLPSVSLSHRDHRVTTVSAWPLSHSLLVGGAPSEVRWLSYPVSDNDIILHDTEELASMHFSWRQSGSLGRVDKPDPDANAAEQNQAKITGGSLVVARRDTAVALQLAKKALDAGA